MDTSKIIKGVVNGRNYTVTAPIVKEDYGLYLKIEGVELPQTYQVDFSNSENNGASVTMIGNGDGVLIPHQFIDTGKDVFAFLYWVGEDFGRTVYKFRIPNKLRPDRTNEEPTPEEQSVIDQTISALNEAVESTQEAQQAIEDMSVSATTLAEGESATVTKSEQEGVVHLEFGIPKGQIGDTPTITASKTGKTTSIYVDGSKVAQIEDGTDGTDGTSPTASVSKSGKVATITITDKNGTTNAQVEDGTDGQDGISPTVTITPITGGHRITITDADGEHSADVMDGDDYTLTSQDKQDIAELVDVPVEDVQINGTSIVEDGVADVPIASASAKGVVGINSWFGININNDGQLCLVPSSLSIIKAGSRDYFSIPPNMQHYSTFYGLAKSAGHDEKNSTLPVGTYTEEAKIAIQKMLGIYEPPYELLNDFTLEEEGGFDLTADMNGVPYDLRNVLIWVTYPANLASVTTGYGRYRCFDDIGKCTNTETGRYTTNTAAMYKYITVDRKANLAFSYFADRTTVGGAGALRIKNMNTSGIQAGISIGLGNITRIACIEPEPAGTQIKIYGQRAY